MVENVEILLLHASKNNAHPVILLWLDDFDDLYLKPPDIIHQYFVRRHLVLDRRLRELDLLQLDSGSHVAKDLDPESCLEVK